MTKGERNFGELPIEEQVAFIMEERTPSPERVIYEPTVEFLTADEPLTREEMAKVIALGDRTAESYKHLARRVVGDRGGTKTSDFFLAYSLAARSSKEISHTSILEQIGAGPEKFGGDPPIIFEGISILSGLRDICSLRYFGFEAFSSRGGIFPENYWRIPKQLVDAGVGDELEKINGKIYQIYLELTRAGIKNYLETMPKKEGEKLWQWRWRVLNHALDDSRQVTNGTFLNHLSMHPNSALSLREAIVQLSSAELPETRELAATLRNLAEESLPTLMRYTESSPYTKGLGGKRQMLVEKLGIKSPEQKGETESRFLWAAVNSGAELKFLAAFIANHGNISNQQALEALRRRSDEEISEMVTDVFSEIGLHDKPPAELEKVQVDASFILSVGAFYEAMRHRLVTHIRGHFTPQHGFTVPPSYKEIELEETYLEAIALNNRQYKIIESLGADAVRTYGPYFVSRAHIIPVNMRLSGLDVFHMLKIRAHPAAHPDISGPMISFEKYLRKNSPTVFNHIVKK